MNAFSEFEYSAPVTRVEVFRVSVYQLLQQKRFQQGQQDRKAGIPCRFNDGCYLSGWYEPNGGLVYIPTEAAHLLDRVQIPDLPPYQH